MVSIVTLTYKNFKGLFDTIDSVLNQDCPEFEYIISDDGSSDFPKQKIIDYIELHRKSNLMNYKVIANDINVGTVKHLNKAIKHCTGEYVFILSCNDFFFNEHVISTLIKAFDDEQCDVLIVSRLEHKMGNIRSMCPHFLDRKRVDKLDTREKMYSAFLKTEHFDMFISPNVFYKRDVIVRNGFFDESYILFEDAPMIAKILWNEKVSIRSDLIAEIYDCKTGVSSSKSKNKLLVNDIDKYNLYGKIDHYDQLDKKTRLHIDFGIKRAKAHSKIEFALVCIRYFPIILYYCFYCLGRMLNGISDYYYIRKLKR